MYEILSVCKGGGYMYCRTNPEHPKRNSNGLYPLHRVLVENKIGRMLNDNEDVHHIDHDKNNNSIDNLQVLTKSDHAKMHKPVLPCVIANCGWCNKEISLKPHSMRLRVKRSKNGIIFCSISCSAKKQFSDSNENSKADPENFPIKFGGH